MSGWWCSVPKQYLRTLSNNSDFRINLFSVRLYLLLFVGGFVSYLRYLWLFAYSGVKYILCCAFVLFVFVSCALCCSGFSFRIGPSVLSNVHLLLVIKTSLHDLLFVNSCHGYDRKSVYVRLNNNIAIILRLSV